MPANVEQMFSVRETPWHREGIVLDDFPQDWDTARKLAGLDWEPESQPCFALVGIDGETGQPIYEPIDGWQRITRSDTGTTLSLNMESYEIIGHAAFGEIFEAVLEQDRDHLKVETGGVLEDGRKVWMLIRLDEPVQLPGDSSLTYPYMALTSRHDGKASTALRSTAVRIVCANTFRAAEMEGERSGLTFSFIHRGKWQDRVTEAREAVTGARREFHDYVELSTHLLGIKVSQAQTDRFITEFVPAPPVGLASDRVLKNVEQARATIRKILASPSVGGAGIEGTVYGLVQAGGEYLDHVRKSNTWETRLNRTLLRPEPQKARALSLALAAAEA